MSSRNPSLHSKAEVARAAQRADEVQAGHRLAGQKPLPVGRPVPWAVEKQEEFHNYQPACKQDSRLRADLLMELDPNADATGRFRWVFSSAAPVVVGFNASEILATHGAEEFNLTVHVRPEEIVLHTNMTVSGWEDVGELVAKGKIVVTRGEEEASHDFLGDFRFHYAGFEACFLPHTLG
jgi:hypothetical protein